MITQNPCGESASSPQNFVNRQLCYQIGLGPAVVLGNGKRKQTGFAKVTHGVRVQFSRLVGGAGPFCNSVCRPPGFIYDFESRLHSYGRSILMSSVSRSKPGHVNSFQVT